MNIGVIDIGSNTINLLVASVFEDKWEKIAAYKNPAKLGKGGIDKNVLSDAAIERGMIAMREHAEKAKGHECEKILAFATAAVRDASNKDVFLNGVKRELDIDVQVIDGDREAELIMKGIRSSGAIAGGDHLIMDIGGGSTEFILIQNDQVTFKKSYRIGVTRLLEKFTPRDPVSVSDKKNVFIHVSENLADLSEKLEKISNLTLVGASGSFDSLAEMYAASSGVNFDPVKNEIPVDAFLTMSNDIITKNYEERSKMKGLALYRVETMPMAIIQLAFVFGHENIDRIIQSSYAMKEGVVAEMVE